jgi:hypothetical protein
VLKLHFTCRRASRAAKPPSNGTTLDIWLETLANLHNVSDMAYNLSLPAMPCRTPQLSKPSQLAHTLVTNASSSPHIIQSLTINLSKIRSLDINFDMSSHQASHQQSQVSGQPEHTPARRADSHHEQHDSVDIDDSNEESARVIQHVGRSGSNRNRSCPPYDGVIYMPIPDEPVSIEGESGDFRNTQSSRHSHTTDLGRSTYQHEDSGYGSHDDVPHEYHTSLQSHWPTYPPASSDETYPGPSDGNDDKSSKLPLTAANVHRNALLSAAHPTPSSPLSPHLTPIQVRCTNRHGNARHDESTFDTLQYLPADVIISVNPRLHSRPRNRDSISFIEGGLLNDNVRPELMRHIERPYENVSGHLKEVARRVAHGEEVKKLVGLFGGRRGE